jgi:hypothetical protein
MSPLTMRQGPSRKRVIFDVLLAVLGALAAISVGVRTRDWLVAIVFALIASVPMLGVVARHQVAFDRNPALARVIILLLVIALLAPLVFGIVVLAEGMGYLALIPVGGVASVTTYAAYRRARRRLRAQ